MKRDGNIWICHSILGSYPLNHRNCVSFMGRSKICSENPHCHSNRSIRAYWLGFCCWSVFSYWIIIFRTRIFTHNY